MFKTESENETGKTSKTKITLNELTDTADFCRLCHSFVFSKSQFIYVTSTTLHSRHSNVYEGKPTNYILKFRRRQVEDVGRATSIIMSIRLKMNRCNNIFHIWYLPVKESVKISSGVFGYWTSEKCITNCLHSQLCVRVWATWRNDLSRYVNFSSLSTQSTHFLLISL